MSRPKSSRSIAADIEKTFKANLKLLESSMEGLEPISRAYLDRLMAKSRLEQQYREERASRGLDPQNLGPVTRLRFDFVAAIEPQLREVNAERRQFEDDLDEEFPSAQTLPEPAPEPKKSKKRTK